MKNVLKLGCIICNAFWEKAGDAELLWSINHGK